MKKIVHRICITHCMVAEQSVCDPQITPRGHCMPHKRSKASSDYRRHRGVTRRAGLPDPPPIPVELQRLPEEAYLRPTPKAVLKPRQESRAVLKPRPEPRLRSAVPPRDLRPRKRARVGSPASSQSAGAAEQLKARAASVGAPASPQPAAKTEIIESIPLPEQVSREIDEIFRVKRERERVKREVKSEVQKKAEIALSLLAGLAQPVKVIEQDSPCSASPEPDPICWEAPTTPPKWSSSSSSSESSSEDESAASGRVDGKAKSAVGTTPSR